MDKAEKLKAARKKLKEFQSHKQEPDASIEQLGSDAYHQQPPADTVPANQTLIDPIAQQQQILPGAPQISNYFDNVNGSSFDLPIQQSTYPPQEFPVFHQQQEVPQQQNFLPTAPANSQFFEQPQVYQNVHNSYYQPQGFQNVQHVQSVHNPYQVPQFQELQTVTMPPPTVDSNDHTLNQQLQHQMTQLKSELEFHRTTALNLQKNTDELNRLRQETLSHVDVVKVLVSEKSSLIDSLHKAELFAKTKHDETEELQNRLNASRHRVKQLETEVQREPSKPFSNQEASSAKIEEVLTQRVKEFQDANVRIEVERDEMKMLLNQKRIELENLQKNFDHLNTELHLANVKIAQLCDGTPAPEVSNQSQTSALSQELAIKQQQITELYSVIDQVNRDKEASDNQYQNYVSHLTREMEALKESSVELSGENDLLVKREQELLKHVGDLERQIQQQIQKQKTYAEDQKEQTDVTSPSEVVQKLSSQVAALTESNETMKSLLAKHEAERNALVHNFLLKEEEMREMELRVERLKTETPNLSQLMTDFEDKSVAASRALTQNQGLKEQLDEMQRAFITMTNDKMELTDKLQSEMHLCKEMKIRYDAMEVELQEMKDKWQYKEDEMIRLSHENTELEKKIFQQNIEIDRLRHYESKEYHGTEGILEKELENNKRRIETLTNKINILESSGDHQHDHDHSAHSHDHSGHSHGGQSHDHTGHSHDHNHQHESNDHKCQDDGSKKHLLDEIEMLKMEKTELIKAMNDFRMSKPSETVDGLNNEVELLTNGNLLETPEMNDENLKLISKSVTPSMATEEALEKLQSRFRRTMLEVAELTEEKQRLEHVVTQLQFETETIGEYITLYQYQRRLLKQKEHERDVQLKSLAADRERMNEKLIQLNGLIEKFVLQHTDNIEFAKEATKLLDQGKDDSEPLVINHDQPTENLMKLKQETAGKILEILSDIKSANSICYESNVGVEHCSCCLGKLETV